MSDKIKTNYPGVRYREHSTKTFNGKIDKYFFIRYRVNGKLKEEGLGWASEGWNAKKASIELTKLKENHVKGEGPQTLADKRRLIQERQEAEKVEKEKEKKESITFSQVFLNQYMPQAKNNKGQRSYKREESLYKLWIAPVIGKTPFKDVTPLNLERIKKNMTDQGMSARSIRYALAVIRQVFNFAKRHDIYKGDNPTAKIKLPQADNRRLRFLTHEEAESLLESLFNKSPLTYEIALMSLYCGMRAGEIFSLTWGDVDIERGMLTLRDTKSGRNRTAFMTQTVRDLLKNKQRGRNNDLVFPGRGGVKITSISNSFDRSVVELGFNEGITDPRQRLVFHSLRHTYASWLVERGVDLYTVKTLLGHSTLALTERYSHLGNNTLQNAIRVIEDQAKVETISAIKKFPRIDHKK